MKGETYARRKAQGCSCGYGCPCSKRQGSTCAAASQACDVVKERAFAVQNKLRLHHCFSQSKAHMQRRSQVGEADLYRRVRSKLGPHVPRASVILYVRAARTSLPRAVRTEGTGQLARARAATAVRYVRDVRVPPSSVLANRRTVWHPRQQGVLAHTRGRLHKPRAGHDARRLQSAQSAARGLLQLKYNHALK